MYYNDELYHHGIKGQRWGVRRYQNEDGTLTSSGQKRLSRNGRKRQTSSADQELMNRLKNVDPELAKNKVTRRVAYDYHNLSDRMFRMKYYTSKKTFAKRYVKTKGNTYGSGVKKAAAVVAAAQLLPNARYTDSQGNTYRLDMGKSAARKYLAEDIISAEVGSRVFYNNAEKRYYNKRNR
jgi:hypothetical protein